MLRRRPASFHKRRVVEDYLSIILQDKPLHHFRVNTLQGIEDSLGQSPNALTYTNGINRGITSLTPSGKAAFFSANSQATATFNHQVGTNKDISMECLVKLTSQFSYGCFIKLDSSISAGCGIGCGTGTFEVFGRNLIFLIEGIRWVDSGFVLPLDEWLHIASVSCIEDSSHALYVNGVKVYEVISGWHPPLPGVAAIGGYGALYGYPRYFTGGIAEVSIYDYKLSQSSISRHYQSFSSVLSLYNGATLDLLADRGIANASSIQDWEGLPITRQLNPARQPSQSLIGSRKSVSFESQHGQYLVCDPVQAAWQAIYLVFRLNTSTFSEYEGIFVYRDGNYSIAGADFSEERFCIHGIPGTRKITDGLSDEFICSQAWLNGSAINIADFHDDNVGVSIVSGWNILAISRTGSVNRKVLFLGSDPIFEDVRASNVAIGKVSAYESYSDAQRLAFQSWAQTYYGIVSISIAAPIAYNHTTTITLALPSNITNYKVAITSSAQNPANKTQIIAVSAMFPNNGYVDTQTVASSFSGTIPVIPLMSSGSYKIVAADDANAYFSSVFTI